LLDSLPQPFGIGVTAREQLVGDVLPARERRRPVQELKSRWFHILCRRLDPRPDRDDDARAPSSKRIVGKRDRQEPGRTGAPDERREAPAQRADLPVRRWAPLGEDQKRSPAVNELDEPTEIGRSRRRSGTPKAVQVRRLLPRDRPPEEVSVFAAKHVATQLRKRPAAVGGTRAERVRESRGDHVLQGAVRA
jgi:hypothetical protein